MAGKLPFITGAIWLFIVWRYIWPMPWGFPGRIALSALVFVVAQFHWITSTYFGSLASPELPQPLLIVLSWAFGSFLLLAMLLLVRDIIGLLTLPLLPAIARALLGGQALYRLLGLLALVLGAVGVWQAVRVPDVKAISISIPGLPPAFDGYRVVQITDTHASRLLPRYWQASVVGRVNGLDPDLIVITGDLADGSTTARADDVRPFQDLQARDGVLSIPGNHEYYSDYRSWMAVYRSLGLNMLENQHVLIQRGGDTLAVAGLTDPQAVAFGLPAPSLQDALHGLEADVPAILLDHRPGNAREHARSGRVLLQLSGHTHGGQITGPHLLTKWANAGFVSGLYQLGSMQLYVSNGTGLWPGLGIRLGRPAEISLLTLRTSAKPG